MKEKKKKCGCIPNKGCRKPQDRYCGEDLECIGVTKGDTFSDALTKINDVVCNEGKSCNLFVEILPTDTTPIINVNGGTPPYKYLWTLQQTGGTILEIVNPQSSSFPSIQITSGQTCISPIPQGIPPCRISYVNIDTDPCHVMHYKLTVTDSLGCKSVDYWTQYIVLTY